MNEGRIFLIDDDADLLRLISDMLSDEGYRVDSTTDPLEGIERIRRQPPDLLLLDIRMRKLSGLEVCKQLKADPRTQSVPIVMLSVRAEESDVVLGLETGAEDYIRKPISRGELLARVRTVLRRKEKPAGPEAIAVGTLVINPATYTATISGTALDLRPKEFELLCFFARREGMVVTRGAISENVWGHEHVPNSQTIEFHVHQLRKKLGRYGDWIESLKGVGYRFEVDEG